MFNNQDTIFALASGFVKAGVSVIRISGNRSEEVLRLLTGKVHSVSHKAFIGRIKGIDDNQDIDEALCIFFRSPGSYTGEDVLELQVHGSRAVVKRILSELSKIDGLRPADRGEFTKRAVLNGKMDITSAEGVNDLINAETFEQVRQALKQLDGGLGNLYDSWRKELINILAHIEAYIDFPEDEIPEDIDKDISLRIKHLRTKIEEHISDDSGQKLRNGYNIAIIGPVNAGKSSLLNRLVKKEAAIVSSFAGTTRDVVEVFMDIDGFPVIFADTAGLRETTDVVEQEGIRRALIKASEADLKIAVFDGSKYPLMDEETLKQVDDKTIIIINKKDLVSSELGTTFKDNGFSEFSIKGIKVPSFLISTRDDADITKLIDFIGERVKRTLEVKEYPVMTNLRHRNSLEECVKSLIRAETEEQTDIKAEDLRLASRHIGVITGSVDVEEVLDVVFKDFCIGK